MLENSTGLYDYLRDPSLRSGRHAQKHSKVRKVSYLSDLLKKSTSNFVYSVERFKYGKCPTPEKVRTSADE